MSELTDISTIWVTGNFESSFTTSKFLHDDFHQITLNSIHFVGRKVLKDTVQTIQPIDGNEVAKALGIQIIQELEVFPSNPSEYPLDMARKMNAYDVHLMNPVYSEIREVRGIRHGKISAVLICKLKRLNKTNDKTLISNSFNTYQENQNNLNSSSFVTDNSTVTENQISGINNNPVSNANGFSGGSGCGNASLSGCMNPLAGCSQIARIGCGTFIGLLLLLGLISFFLKTCQRQTDKLDVDDKKVEEIKSDTVSLSEKEVFVLSNVQFFTNSDKLLPSSYEDLDRLALYLFEHPEYNVEIIGHTDNRGAQQKNKILSQNRAEAVKQYLIQKGVGTSRLIAIGKGDTEPRASNNTKEGMLMNRRVEIKLLKNINSK